MHSLQPETNPFIRRCLDTLVRTSGVRIASVARDMFYGVAFPTDDTKVYDLYSHEGDGMGKYSTHEINMTIFSMRRYLGLRVGKVESFSTQSRQRPGFTFAWSAWFDWHHTATRVPVTLYSLAPVEKFTEDCIPPISIGDRFPSELYG